MQLCTKLCTVTEMWIRDTHSLLAQLPSGRPAGRTTDMDNIIPWLLLACGWARSELLQDFIQKRSNYGVYAKDFSQDYEPYVFAAIPLHPPMPVLHVLSPSPLSAPNRDLHHSASKHHSAYSKPSYHTHYSTPSFSSSQYNRPSQGNSFYGKTFSSSDFSSLTSPDFSKLYFPTHTRPSFVEYPQTSFSHKEYPRPRPYEYPTYAESTLSAETDLGRLYSSSVPYSYLKSHHNSYDSSQESSPTILYAQPTALGGYSYHKKPTKKRKILPKKKIPTESPVIIRVHKHRITRS
uniref:Uncharacterized protein n=2 Tax=Bombyx mori TaxID=7091 RepID=A0A8R1WLT5_BOMMO|nr:uncharacterized protein LOC101737274 [Bombyx mori]